MTYIYTIYGITLAVPFPCPILTNAAVHTAPDVTIIEGPVPRSLEAPIVTDHNWDASPGRFLLRGGRRAGRFLVENGQRITLYRNPTADDELLCANLLTTVVVALLRQRGQLVLHASVVITKRGAIAISGASGAGKSTAQAELLARGCQMVADDVTVLRLGSNGEILVYPGVPKMNLCEDAAIKIGHDIEQLGRNPLRKIKVFVPVDYRNMATEPVELKELYLLNKHPGNDFIVKRLTGSEKFRGQQESIYGPLFPEEHPRMFSFIRALADQVEMIRIDRPAHGCSVKRVVEAILHG